MPIHRWFGGFTIFDVVLYFFKSIFDNHASARERFAEAGEALGRDMAALCFEGPEDELKKTKYNKHTQAHIGKLKAKLATLRDDVAKGSGASYGPGFNVKKSGNATVLLVGFPSVGKSTPAHAA